MALCLTFGSEIYCEPTYVCVYLYGFGFGCGCLVNPAFRLPSLLHTEQPTALYLFLQLGSPVVTMLCWLLQLL